MTGRFPISGWMRHRLVPHRRFNPYVVGTPVFDRHLFFGRERLARRALELLATRSVELTGERRIGKTSFLHHLRRVLAAGNGAVRCFPIFVDLEGVAPRDLLRALVEEAVEALAVPPRTLLDLRLGRGGGECRAADFDHDLRRMVEDLTRRMRQPVRLVFLIDEVDALDEDAAPVGEARLDPLLSGATPEFRVVLAGVGRDGGARETRLRRGHVESLEIEPLTPDDAEALVREPVAGAFRYEPSAVERILQVSRLRPFAIQKLCFDAVNRMLDDGRTTVRVTDVEAAG